MNRPIEGFKELYQDLIDDCISFDSNQERKAKDIAGRIRTLLKDGPNKYTRSILQQLGKKNILFKDSSIPYTTNPGFSYFDINGSISNSVISVSGVYMGLLYKKVQGSDKTLEFSFAPLCRRQGLKLNITEKPFNEWWEQIVYEDPFSSYKLTRKDLILSSAEKDGFAHFDPTLNEEYEKFLQSDSLDLIINEEKIKFKNNPAKNSIRQIGFEVIMTLKDKLNGIIK
ncbi:hypothetical protein SAMN02927916_1228 [Flavobacterium anhuiense]|uniref:Uncharacterized protein n=1 Tax=Flavobacterium anhuiense TaxID=459526 RepID=A0ABY0LG10_9FLAO|nr:hypothetical protein [Flavobacterium anhuiense]SCY13651.1 hypothetical protein SAMN02927916_1228 [Flavobacterium anhuiense]